MPASEKLILPAREGYDRWAPHYDQSGNPAVTLKERELERLLGDVRGLRVADLGCGTGRAAVTMAKAGAEVTAVDFSEGMLAQARQRPGAGSVRFFVHDLNRPLPLAARAFDLVVCSLALEHVDRLDVAFSEMARIACPGGRVVVLEMHPALLLREVSAYFHDPKTGQGVRPRSVGHQTSDFLMAALRVGLVLVEMRELFHQTGSNAGWPFLLTLQFSRPDDSRHGSSRLSSGWRPAEPPSTRLP